MTNKKELYFDFLHSFIVITAVFFWFRFVRLDFNIKAELIVMKAVQGFFIGAFASFVWEFIIEELIMDRPASKKDVVNMCASATLAGILCVYVTIPLYVTIPMIAFSIYAVINEIRVWYKNRTK